MEPIRKGQQLFNFLEWLREHKDYCARQSFRMADPFHISDEDYNNLLKEYETWLLSTQKK